MTFITGWRGLSKSHRVRKVGEEGRLKVTGGGREGRLKVTGGGRLIESHMVRKVD